MVFPCDKFASFRWVLELNFFTFFLSSFFFLDYVHTYIRFILIITKRYFFYKVIKKTKSILSFSCKY